LKAGRYGVFGTSAALSSCGNRHLPLSQPVYRVSVAETSCPAVDLAFSGGSIYVCTDFLLDMAYFIRAKDSQKSLISIAGINAIPASLV
jgi:hypothetical protein